MMPSRSQSGFTLLETLIYALCLSFMLAGMLGAAYGIIQNTDTLATSVATAEEGTFLTRKIAWALTNANTLSFLAPGQLTISRLGTPTSVKFRSNGTDLEINTSGGWVTLNGAGTSISSVSFAHLLSPEGVQATLFVNKGQFTVTQYLRK